MLITPQHAAFGFDRLPSALMSDHLGIGELAELNTHWLSSMPMFFLAEVDELLATRLVFEILNGSVLAVGAIANQGMDHFIADAIILAQGIRAREALGGDLLPGAAASFAGAQVDRGTYTGGVSFLVCCWQKGQSRSVLGFNTRGLWESIAIFFRHPATQPLSIAAIDRDGSRQSKNQRVRRVGSSGRLFSLLLEGWPVIVLKVDYCFPVIHPPIVAVPHMQFIRVESMTYWQFVRKRIGIILELPSKLRSKFYTLRRGWVTTPR